MGAMCYSDNSKPDSEWVASTRSLDLTPEQIMLQLVDLRRNHEKFTQQPNLPYASKIVRQNLPKTQLPNGSFYTGEWDMDSQLMDGEGVLFSISEGLLYEGRFIRGKKSTNGRAIFLNGDWYQGQWANDEMHGYGKFVSEKGKQIYTGQFEKNTKHGQGKETFGTGQSFEGTYVDGKRTGKGVFVWSAGCRYEGDFKDDQIHGVGKCVWPDGRSYEGEWQNGMQHGKGIQRLPNGKTYDGLYKEDKKHGYGVYTWPDGSRYEGGWVDGKMHGMSKLINAQGQVKKEIWVMGEKKSLD